MYLKILLISIVMVVAQQARAIDLEEHPEVKVVADKLVADGHYQFTELERIFAQAEISESVLKAMMSPAEYKFTWGKYRKLFLKEDRIAQGVDFWARHKAQLTRAEKEFGVPAEIIVAIIGVESKYGKYKGSYKVLDSLVSLVSSYPRRSKFFAGELEHFLILSKENNLDANQILGSYAGAVGFPQFISSSYRNYSIDFNGDGKTDLINQVDDAIGSIANYFIENGWKPDQPVTSKPVTKVNKMIADLANRKRKVQHTAESLLAKGAVLSPSITGGEKLGVLMLDSSEVVHDKNSATTYIVRAGDTACQIAERFSMPCKTLFRLNKLNSKGDIFRGQQLKVNTVKSKSTTAGSASKKGKWEVGKVDQKANKEAGPAPVYFYTHSNFYAITKYNHSVLYAMAVHDLSQAIAEKYRENHNL